MATIAFRFLSWNLKDFGNYDYSSTMDRIAGTIIEEKADIVVLLELAANRRPKRAKTGVDSVLPGAEKAVDDLLSNLKAKDKNSNWKVEISAINCANKDRDGYAFFWKSTPITVAPVGFAPPTHIELVSGPEILTEGLDKTKRLSFQGSRRPGACQFELSSTVAGVPKQNVWVCGFHAYADFKVPNDIQNSIKDCLTAANALNTGGTPDVAPVLVGGDLNIDFGANKPFYMGLKTNLGFDTGITDSIGSSILANPNFSVAKPVLVKNAFDNFLFKNLQTIPAETPVVVDVVGKIADKIGTITGNKRPREVDIKEAWGIHYPKNIDMPGLKTSCISDHFPIIGAFSF